MSCGDMPSRRKLGYTGAMTALTLLLLVFAISPLRAQTPAFTDPQRAVKLKGALPEIEKIMAGWAGQRAVPGMSWGVVIEGEGWIEGNDEVLKIYILRFHPMRRSPH